MVSLMFGNAEAYTRFMGRWSRLLAPLLMDFADVSDAGRVLDIGSGIGALAFEVAGRDARRHVTGIDRSKEFVDYATSRNPHSDRVRFYVGDAQDLQFADATFDASLSMLVLNFIPDPERALREARRVTCPAGRIAAAVWDYGGVMRMLRAFWDAVVDVDPESEKRDEKHMPLCRAGELSQLWRRCGLENVYEDPLDITMKFDSFADYWEPFLLGQGPAGAYVQTLHDENLQALRSAVKRQLPLSSESDPFTLPARAWGVRGTVPARG
jgi:SAM-dependent methyltransferase